MMTTKIQQKRVSILTNNLNCERHVQYYSTIEKYFKENHWEISTSFNTDLVIICGCGFHNMMLEKIKNLLKTLDQESVPEQKIVIMGCINKTHSQSLQNNFRGILVDIHNESKLDEIILASTRFSDIPLPNVFSPHENSADSEETNMFYIKISEGCLRGCSFCVINKAKGYIRSMPLADILAQYTKAVHSGYKRIFLMGEDTFAYGYDIGSNIIDLMNKLLYIQQDTEFCFGNLHNRWLVQYAEEIIDLCTKGNIKKIHIGLQHNNNDLLKAMGRDTDFQEIYSIVRKLKAECPEVYLGVDLLVGFPGETEEMFGELLDFIRLDKCFNNIQHNGYSDVTGARSTQFDNKNSSATISTRWLKLTKLLQERSAFNRQESPNNFDATYKATRDFDYSFCKNTYIR